MMMLVYPGEESMASAASPLRRYAVAAGLGAFGGGLLVALAGKLLPRTISNVMAGMVEQMMARMGEREGHLPDT
jgi:hypothetical protein